MNIDAAPPAVIQLLLDGMSNEEIAEGLDKMAEDYEAVRDQGDNPVYKIIPPVLREAASRLRAEERNSK